jgi:GNAT superfamily N-acetyltransferase
MIRCATDKDEAAVFCLAGKLATSFDVTESGFASSFQSILQADHMLLIVADTGDGIIGYALASCHPCFYASGNVAWTDEIFVEPDNRQEGIGRKLMLAVEEWAEEHGCKVSALATRRAAPFYEALDYEASATYFKKTIGESGRNGD